MSLEQQQALDATYVMQTYKRKPVEFVRGEGMRLYDDAGTEYLDFLSGIGVVSVGHANPRVTAAIQQQAAKLLQVSNYFSIEGRGELAEKLSGLLNAGENPGTEPWRVFFTNSGTESIEGAIKLAHKYGIRHLEGASTIITAHRSFHGRTLAALAATGQPSKQELFKPLPSGFVHVDINDIHALKTMLNQGFGGKAVCAVLLECVQGEGGVYPCTEEYLRAVRQLTEEHNALLIFDEVQTGFYRTGAYPFAFQQYGVVPDVVTLAKGLGGGVPIGALAAHGIAAEVLEPGDHGSTFGGGPLVVAAANATLDELVAMDAGKHVAEVGAYLRERLESLEQVTEVRGRGLMLGAELRDPIAEAVVEAGLEAGLVLNNIGHHILRFLPPLVCT
ncbi:MAG: aspartate aminotransferase family protein, partial [Coriobacteriales bacterium]|nr:aspartate aminotransferase family protein [Coriobacteriales bacterium]